MRFTVQENLCCFLNGIMMSTKSWSQFVEPLSHMNQLILVDFLDQRQSTMLDGQTFTHQIQTEMIEPFLDHLNLDEISLFVFHMAERLPFYWRFAILHVTQNSYFSTRLHIPAIGWKKWATHGMLPPMMDWRIT